MHEPIIAILVAVLAFAAGAAEAVLVKTIHLEQKEHEHKDSL